MDKVIYRVIKTDTIDENTLDAQLLKDIAELKSFLQEHYTYHANFVEIEVHITRYDTNILVGIPAELRDFLEPIAHDSTFHNKLIFKYEPEDSWLWSMDLCDEDSTIKAGNLLVLFKGMIDYRKYRIQKELMLELKRLKSLQSFGVSEPEIYVYANVYA